MKKLNLCKYIRLMLGEPIIKVDLTDEQIYTVIDTTVQKYLTYAYFPAQKEPCRLVQGRVHIPTFESVHNVFIDSSSVEFEFNHVSKILDIHQNINKTAVVEGRRLMSPKELDDVYDILWVKEYATALTKNLWGNAIGKYNRSVLDAEINYDRIISESQADLERLEESLIDYYPAPISVTYN